MKVHLIKKLTIDAYIRSHAHSKSSFENWLTGLKYADWDRPDDILQTFGKADLSGSGTNRVVFNVGGNNYRMVCKYHFGSSRVHLFVCWIGTHAEYRELCDRGGQYTINAY